MPKINERYRIDNFLSAALEGNPLNTPANRDLKIYLPPGYFESEDKRYPTIYYICLLYTSPSPRDRQKSRMPSSA